MNKKWMIYGANGYTGELMAREAVKRGYRPVLAGRNQSIIQKLASELNLDYRVFPLINHATITSELSDIQLVLNCAGPFTKTAKAMLEACLSVKCHYLDISGEMTVFEHCFSNHERGREQGCIICPGAAFDIVPTEAAAAKLKELLPDATILKLGFDGQMALSPGSSLTLLEGIGNLSVYLVRENGNLVALTKPCIEDLSFSAGSKKQKAMAITWADLNGAYYSTRIPNIAVFVSATIVNRVSFAYMHLIKPIIALPSVQKLSAKLIKLFVKGPSTKDIEAGSMAIFGEAHNLKGDVRRIYFKVAHGYKFTYLAALAIVEFCLSHQMEGGYYTPSMLMGTDFVETLEGSSKFVFD